MANVRIELNESAVRDLMRSPEIQRELEAAAETVMSRLPDGYSKDIYTGKTRSNVAIWPSTEEARKDNLKNDTLLKAVQG